MLIIIEGPDGVGKTTFIEGLKAHMTKTFPTHVIDVMRRGVPKQHPLDEYVTPLLDYVPRTKHHIITDRWHVGEWVYPSVLKRKTKADRATWYYIEMFLQSRGAIIVHLDDKEENIAQRVRDRGDALIIPEMTPQIAQAYRFMYDEHLIRHTRFRVDGKLKNEHAYHWLISRAGELEHHASDVWPFKTFVGHPSATTLLVGDIRHNVKLDDPSTYHDKPAFMPYPATSGHFLLKHLQRHTIHNGMAMVNACDVDDIEKVISAVQPLLIVALGENAAKKIGTMGFFTGFGAVPHPQYVRRFHNKSGDAYASVIAQAARAQKDMRAWRP